METTKVRSCGGEGAGKRFFRLLLAFALIITMMPAHSAFAAEGADRRAEAAAEEAASPELQTEEPEGSGALQEAKEPADDAEKDAVQDSSGVTEDGDRQEPEKGEGPESDVAPEDSDEPTEAGDAELTGSLMAPAGEESEMELMAGAVLKNIVNYYGVLHDDHGNPLVGVPVRAIANMSNPTTNIMYGFNDVIGTDITNANGEFTISGTISKQVLTASDVRTWCVGIEFQTQKATDAKYITSQGTVGSATCSPTVGLGVSGVNNMWAILGVFNFWGNSTTKISTNGSIAKHTFAPPQDALTHPWYMYAQYYGNSDMNSTATITMGSPTARTVFSFIQDYDITENYLAADGTPLQTPNVTQKESGETFTPGAPPTTIVSGLDTYYYTGHRLDTTTGVLTPGTPAPIGPIYEDHDINYYYVKDSTDLTVKHEYESGGTVAPDETYSFTTSTNPTYATSPQSSVTGLAVTRVTVQENGGAVTEVANVDSTGTAITGYTINPTVRGETEVVYYYDRDSDTNQIPDYDVVRAWEKSDGSPLDAINLPNLTDSVNAGSFFTKSSTQGVLFPPIVSSLFTYQGYKINGGALQSGTPNVKVTVANRGFTIAYVYSLNNYGVTVNYVDRSDAPIGSPTSNTYSNVAGGTTNYSPTPQTIPGYTLVDWKIGSGGALQGNTNPSITVNGNTTLYYVYGKDSGGGGSTSGPGNGVEDFDVVRSWEMNDGSAISGLPNRTEFWDVGETFNKKHSDNVTVPAGLHYDGYRLDTDAPGTVNAGDPSFAITVANGDRAVAYIYSLNTYNLTVNYEDRGGAVLKPQDVFANALTHGQTKNVAAYDPGFTNKVLVGWYKGAPVSNPALSSPVTLLTGIAGNQEITLVYGKDNGGGGTYGPADNTEDFDVTRKWEKTDGTPVDSTNLPNLTNPWNVGEYFQKAHNDDINVIYIDGWTYQGYRVGSGATVYPGTPNEQITVPKGDFTITYVYARTTYSTKVNYVNRNAVSLQLSTTTPMAHGSTFDPLDPSAPAITNRVCVGWYEGAPNTASVIKTGSIAAETGINPVSATSVKEITLVYGRNTAGPNGSTVVGTDTIEDFDVIREWKMTDGTPISSITPNPKVEGWNVGDTFNRAHNVGVTIPAGLTYAGFKYDTDLPGDPLRTGAVSIVMGIGDRGVTYYYTTTSYTVNVSYRYDANDGTQTALPGSQSAAVYHNNNFTPSTTPQLKIPTAADHSAFDQKTLIDWELDGVAQGNTNPGIMGVTAGHSIVLIYGQDMDRNGTQDFTVTENHKNGSTTLATYARYINKGSTYAGAVDAGVTASGYTYAGYTIQGGLTDTAPMLPQITNVQAEHVVTLDYTLNGYAVAVSYRYDANDGTQTALTGSQNVSINHGSNFDGASTPQLKIPTAADHADFDKKVLVDWELDGVAQGNTSPGILNVTAAHSIVLVYAQDMNNNGVRDYTVLEKFQTELGGTILANNPVYVDEGDTYTMADPDAVVPSGSGAYYTKYALDGAPDVPGAVKPITVVNVTADHEVIYKYLPNDYTVTVTYEYRANNGTVTAIGAPVNQSQTITHGNNFDTASVPQMLIPTALDHSDFDQKVLVDWEIDGISQGNATPGIQNVISSHSIVFVYAQDMDRNGVRDYTITENHETGKLADNESYARYINEGQNYSAATSATVVSKGYEYLSYAIDSGMVSGLAPSLPGITNVTAEHTVVLTYNKKSYPVAVQYKYVANNGTVTGLPGDKTVTIEHGTNFNSTTPVGNELTAPEYSLGQTSDPFYRYKTFDHWTLDGTTQAGAPGLTNVTGAHTVVIYYVQDMTEDRQHDWTVTENHMNGASQLATYSRYVNDGDPYAGSADATVVSSGYTYASYDVDAGASTGTAPATPSIAAVTKDQTVVMEYFATVYPVTVTYVYRDNAGNPDAVIGSAVNQSTNIAHGGSFTANIPAAIDHSDFAGKAFVGYTVDGGAQQSGSPTLSSVTVPGTGGSGNDTYEIVLIYMQDGDNDGNPDVTVTKNHLENRSPFGAMTGTPAETTYVNFAGGATTAIFNGGAKNFGAKWAYDHFDVNAGPPSIQYATPAITVNLGDNNFTVNYYYEKVAPPAPVINNVKEIDTQVSGTGYEPGNTITLTWPDTSTSTATVQSNGTWTLSVPGSVTLAAGDTLVATETNDWSKVSLQGSIVVGLTSYKVEVSYQYKNGTSLPGITNATVAHGASYAVPDPGFNQKVLINWTLDGVAQNNTAPMVNNAAKNYKVVLIYGQDMNGNGVEDFTIYESFVDKQKGSAIAAPNEVYVDKGDTYTGTAKSYAGHRYHSFAIKGGATGSAPNVPTISNVQSDQEVVFYHSLSSYTITVKHVDTDGNSIGNNDYTQSVLHGEGWKGSVATIKGYDFSSWNLNSLPQTGKTVGIGTVLGDTTVTLVYAKQAAPAPQKPDYGNYSFVKKPNVKNVAAGETVDYTFAEFGNAWPVAIEEYSIIDRPDRGLDFVSASLPAFTQGAGVTYNVIYHTNYRYDQVLHSNVPADVPFTFSAPMLSGGEYITALEIEFGTVPAGFAVGDTMRMTFRVWDNPPASTLTNVGILAYKANGEYKEFTSGDSGMVIIGGWFTGLPQTGNGAVVPVVALVAFLSLAMLAEASRRQRKVHRQERMIR